MFKFSERLINEILIKLSMSLNEAWAVLDLPPDTTDINKIKSQYRRKSLENHPDKGGSHEDMIRVNTAKEIIDGYLSGERRREDARDEMKRRQEERKRRDEELAKKNKEKSDKIKSEMKKAKSKYVKHFKELANKDVEMYVKTKDTTYFSNLEYKFRDKDGTEFTIEIQSYFTEADNEKTYYDSDIYFEKRKYKMQRSRTSKADNFHFFTIPENLFPKKKLKKIFSEGGKEKGKRTTFKRRDAEAILQKELHAKRIDGDNWKIPVDREEETYIVVYRYTMMRQGSWGVNGLYKKYSRIAVPKNTITYLEIMEKEEGEKDYPTVRYFKDFIEDMKEAKKGRYQWNGKTSSLVNEILKESAIGKYYKAIKQPAKGFYKLVGNNWYEYKIAATEQGVYWKPYKLTGLKNARVDGYLKDNRLKEVSFAKVKSELGKIHEVKSSIKQAKVKTFKNWKELRENFDSLNLDSQVETFLAILQKTHGYYWAGIKEASELLKVIKNRKKLLDGVEKTEELHPDRIKYFRNYK